MIKHVLEKRSKTFYISTYIGTQFLLNFLIENKIKAKIFVFFKCQIISTIKSMIEVLTLFLFFSH